MKNYILLLNLFLSLTSCKVEKEEDEYDIDATSELAQLTGDAVASVDEAGGDTSGAISFYLNSTGFEKAFARLSPSTPYRVPDFFISRSYATACNAVTFDACTNSSRTRNFSGCTLSENGTISGNVVLNFTGSQASSCRIPAANDAVSRVPNFTISGLRGAQFAVTAPSTGQSLTRQVGGAMTFSNAGVNRKFTSSKGTVILDVTTTASGVTVFGGGRHGRTMDGGTINVADNLTGLNCNLVPNTLTWGANCNCPTSGSLSGSCSDASTMTVTFLGSCGDAAVSRSESKIIKMDRCQTN